jgi:NAD(P)-dependent dehydrogenase (short-subunit alcohol dehydrogenase family)
MKKFKEKVAVITGGASGIGLARARRCLNEGMKVVLADIEQDALDAALQELGAPDAPVLGVKTDVAKEEDIQALADKTLEAFGGVHLLFNNAGVAAGKAIWECTPQDCQWMMGVNLWGVIHGLRIFTPIMLGQNTECHIVNTSSAAGLLTAHPSALYQLTKHAVVGLSEQHYHALTHIESKVGVSVLCPAFVNTNIMDSDRNRPEELRNQEPKAPLSPQEEQVRAMFRDMVASGLSPDQVADMVFRAIQENRFYIITHPDIKPLVRQRLEWIITETNPKPKFV